jgi:hypothetical protein
METGNSLRTRGGRAAVAALTLTLLAWPSLGSARHSDGRWTETESVGHEGCAWIDEGFAGDAETRSLCGCDDVITITTTDEAGSVDEWQDVSWEDDGTRGGSSSGGSGGGSTSGGSGTSASGTSASSTSASGTSGGSSSASGTSGGSTSTSSTSASSTSASSAGGGTSASSGSSASSGGYNQDSSGDGGRSWAARYLPWLLIGLGILVLALLFLAFERSRRRPAVQPPVPDSYAGQDQDRY